MSDKNRTPEEDYLDSLLRSITGGNDEEELDDNFIAGDMDFDKEVNGGMSEEEFLSDFEKEFFGADIDEAGGIKADASQPKISAPQEPEDITFPELDLPLENSASVEKEESMENITLDELVMPEETPSEPEDMKIPEFDFDEDIINVSNEQAMVEEAIANEDSSVEADLQGLYGILGMGNEGSELPADIEDAPKKKKGLFSKKDKKEKKEKKEKKRKDKKKKELEEEVANTLVVEGEGLEDFDFSDVSLDSLGMNDGSSDAVDGGAGEAAFDMSGLDETAGSDGELGFDDSIFAGMDDGGEIGENGDVFFEEEPFGDEEAIDEEAELKAKKKQEKKEEKERKKKEKEKAKKEKEKEKKKKPKKPAKPKKVKEPDEIIKISPIFIVFAISFVVIIVLVAKIGGEYYHYNEKFYEAVSLYVYGNELEEGETLDQEAYESKFADAYNLIYGMEMKEKDHQVFYDQLTTIMLMDRHYEAYKSFMLNEDFAHGLDSLVKAVKMYDKYQNEARDLKCFDEMTVVLGWTEKSLLATYGVSLSEARELSMIKDDDDYAVKVRQIAAKAEEEYNKNKVDEE